MERPRKPSELSRFVDGVFQSIEGNEEAKKEARLRRGYFKEFIREIFPLSIFASWRYPEDQVLCIPRIGNQGYDAKITNLGNKSIERIEVTWPEDGQLQKYEARCLNERGYTDVRIVDPRESRTEIEALVLRVANDKSRKDYGDSSLLVVFDLWPSYSFKQPDTQRDLDQLVELLRSMDFRARSVFLIPLPRSYVAEYAISPVIHINDN